MRRMVGTMLVATMGALVTCASIAAAQGERGDENVAILSVSGQASIDVSADEVRLSIAVESEGPEPQRVIEENSQRVAHVLDTICAEGLDEDEISTGRFSIQPIYSQADRGERNFVPEIRGYRVQNSLIVKTEKLRLAGDLIQAAVDAGANRIDSVSFGLGDPRTSRGEVVALAVANARADAQAAAEAAGVRLGDIRRLAVDQYSALPMMRSQFRAEAMGAADGRGVAPPMVPGEVSVSASVTIEYEIEQ